jgi:hypothetical protein
MAAAAVDPRIGAALPGYLTMRELPACLEKVESLARTVYESGWLPPDAPGPPRNELVGMVMKASCA